MVPLGPFPPPRKVIKRVCKFVLSVVICFIVGGRLALSLKNYIIDIHQSEKGHKTIPKAFGL